jgi:hypothetical protein
MASTTSRTLGRANRVRTLCQPNGSAPGVRSVFEICASKHVEGLVDASGALTRCSPKRLVDGVFDRGSAELGSGSAECMLVDVDQMLAHHADTYQ